MSRYRFVQAALALLLALVATFSALPARVAFAATPITDCSNPDAIEALLEGGGDFVFNCGTVTITFNNQINLLHNLTIDGGGTTTFSIPSPYQLFIIEWLDHSDTELHLTGLTIDGTGMAITSHGGVVVLNDCTLTNNGVAVTNDNGSATLNNSTFSNNGKALDSVGGSVYVQSSSFSGSTGGAVFAFFPLDFTVADSTFTSNSTLFDGGAIYVRGDGGRRANDFSISGGSFTNNHASDGGAIYVDNDFSQSPLEFPKYTQGAIDGVSFSGNSANQDGGAIANHRGDLVVTNSTFDSNTSGAGGAINNGSTPAGWDPNTLAISTSAFTGNTSAYGSAVNNRGILSIARSTFVNNHWSATFGSALRSEYSAAVTDSTFSSNQTAIRNDAGALTVSSSTFSGDWGPATIVAVSGSVPTIDNSILDAGTGSACAGTVFSGGHNIVSDASCAFAGAGDRNSTAPLIGPLANNGGPTQTFALLSGSPAFDTGACPGLTVDQRGVTRPQGAACDVGAVEDDSSGPDTSFVNPPAVTGAAGGPFAFTSSEAGSTFQCQLDSGSFSPCTSPVSYPGLPEGQHTLQIKATDQSGQIDSTPASLTWIVDLTPPETGAVTDGPGAFSNQTTPTFSFSATDASGVAGFQCRLQSSSTLVQDWKACTSPASFTITIPFFTPTQWTLRVRAIDVVGNVDASPSIYGWISDDWSPVTSLDSTPPKQSGSTSATFTFSAFDNLGIAGFECKLDAGDFSACASPLTYTALRDGQHTFVVRAIDLAGNVDDQPRSYTWSIDSGPPDTSILTMPAAVSNVTSPSFTFSGTDGGNIARFECRLDGATFSTCTSPATVPGLSEGSHTFEVRAVDNADLTDLSPAAYIWIVDTTMPDTTILTQPAVLSSDPAPALTFSGSDANGIASFECALDSGTFAACSSPNSLSGLADGAHSFQVRASDSAGNVDSTPASYSWTIDATAPDTSFLTTPATLSGSADASFTFSGSDNQGVAGYECALDGVIFSPCTSPLILNALTDGPHTLQVRAGDAAGNADPSPASFAWTVDTLAPDTTLLTTPSSVSNVTAPSFTFSGSDANGISGFECKLDSAAFLACSSPVSFSGLSDGGHTVQVRAIDLTSKVDPSPATYNWTIDTTTPDTTLLTHPASLSASATAGFTFSGSDLSSVSFECQLDGGGFTACASPAEYGALAGGAHTFQVRAIDAAGNVDPTPAGAGWTVDLAAPDTTLLTTPPTLSGSATAVFTFSGNDANGVASFECALDGSAFNACLSPLNFTGLADGAHTLQVRAIDNAGNTDPSPASYTWAIDTVPPDTTLLTTPPSNSNSATPAFTFSGSDTSGIARFECKRDNGEFSTCTTPAALTGLTDGAHTFQVRAVDNAGKTDPSPAIYTWTVDLTPPDTSIRSTPPALSNNPAPAFAFAGSDLNGITGYQCKLDAADYATCPTPTTLSGLSDGSHTLQVRAVDTAGNLDATPASCTWTVDLTAPVSNPSPSGAKSGDWFVDSTSISLSASDLNGVGSIKYKLDAGAWQTYSAPFSVTTNGTHSIAYYAVDAAGNTETTRTFTLKIDASAPSISITAPVGNQAYLLNSVVNVAFTCSDPGGSGIASCAGSAAVGSPLDTSTSTTRTFTVTATDNVGKTTVQSVTYTVGYAFTPISSGSGGYGNSNQVFAGQPVSLKFTLGGNFGLNVLRAGFPQMQQVSCTNGASIGSAVALPVVSGLQYLPAGYYQIVWKTQASWTGKCYQVVLGFNDGSTYRLNYRFTSMPGS